jgi:hypothetical protein
MQALELIMGTRRREQTLYALSAAKRAGNRVLLKSKAPANLCIEST